MAGARPGRRTVTGGRHPEGERSGPSTRGQVPAAVAVILVNWNNSEDSLHVLAQLDGVGLAPGRELRHVVVDNASTDGSAERIRAERPDVRLIEAGANDGFAAGNVIGIREAVREPGVGWVLIINSDVTVSPDFLEPLIEACSEPEVAAASPRIYYEEPKDRLWAAGGLLRLRETVTRELGRDRPDGPPFDRPRDVTYLTTCCLLVSVEALETVGLFDPLYFICVEDADWCRRAALAGYRLRYVPESRIWHRVSASTGGGYTPLRTYHTARSNALFVRRHHGAAGLAYFVAVCLAALPVAFVRELFHGNTRAVWAKARGLWRGLRDPLTQPPPLSE